MTDASKPRPSEDSEGNVSDERLSADLEKRINALPPHLRDRLRNKLKADEVQTKQSSIEPREEPGKLLSLAQKRLWIQHRLQPDSSAYHIAQLHSIQGALNIAALENALKQVVARQNVLRTRFIAPSEQSANQPEVRIEENWGTQAMPGFLLLERPEVEPNQRRAAAEAWAANENALPIDLETDPVFRARVLRFAPDHHALLLITHHIVADGWSIGLLWKELGLLYGAISAGNPTHSVLPELTVSYTDFAHWEQDQATGAAYAKSETYWRKMLKGAPELLALPTDRARKAKNSRQGGHTELLLRTDLTRSLGKLARSHSVTLFVALTAGLAVLLSRLALTKDVVIGTPLAGRDQAETQNLIGFFIRNLVLRVNLADDPTVANLLQRTQSTLGNAIEHSDLPFDKLVELLKPSRALSHTPLFQVSIAFQEFSSEREELCLDGLTVDRWSLNNEEAKFDLALSIQQGLGTDAEGCRVVAGFDLDLFDKKTVSSWLRVYSTLLEEMVAHENEPVSRLQSAKPSKPLRRPAKYSACWDVATHFEAVAAKFAPSPALVSAAGTLTYQQLNGKANALALRLSAEGITAGDVVGIHLQARENAIVAMLAVVKCAAVYLPIDPTYPDVRRTYMLENSGARLVLTDKQSASCLYKSHASVPFSADELREEPDNPTRSINSDHPAYVIYTSGSSGAPKGTIIPHRGITSLVIDTNYLPFGPEQRILQIASLAFDAATFEIWGSLLHGSACVLYDHPHVEPDALASLLQNHNVSSAFLNTALFNTLIDTAPETLAPLTHLLIGGESLSPTHITRAQRSLPHLQLSNAYGPTEATTFTTHYSIPKLSSEAYSRIPIGKPNNNRHAYVLDEANQLVANGVPGELFIGGPGVALGYVGNPELTDQVFLEIDLPSGRERLYRSGDIVRWLPNDQLDFLGRRDHQVKIRGYRVEPDELDHVLATHPEVAEAASVVIMPAQAEGDPKLVSWVVAKPNKQTDTSELRRWLKTRLPDYQIPDQIHALQALPLGATGKIDRNALKHYQQKIALQGAHKPNSHSKESSPTELWIIEELSFLLGIALPSPNDNFFEIGGNSLLAVRLIAKISEKFDVELPLAILFQTSSLSELSAAIDNYTDNHDWSVLVSIREGGNRPPLFMVHAVGGNVLGFAEFANHLHPEQPLIGVQARGYMEGQTPHGNLQEMAHDYVRAILANYPDPPYLLGGLSMGGIIAFEMARQLADLGLAPSYLMIGDTYTKTGPQFKKLGWKAARGYYPFVSPVKTLQLLGRKLTRRRVGRSSRAPVNEQHERLLEAHHKALADYIPGQYAGPITLVRGTSTSRKILRLDAYFRDRSLGWSTLTRNETRVEFLPGGHHDIFYNAGARAFAETLDRTIMRAQTSDTLASLTPKNTAV